MNSSALEAFLAGQGLWLAPVADAVRAMGLETIDDLRCCFQSPEKAQKRGGPTFSLAWQVAAEEAPADLSAQVLEAVQAFQREKDAVAFLRCPPALAAAARPKRAKLSQRLHRAVDGESSMAARRASSEVAVQLSFSWGA